MEKMPTNHIHSFNISLLVKKYLKGSCSNEEVLEIIEFFKDPNNDNFMQEAFESQWDSLHAGSIHDAGQSDNKLMLDQILDKLHHQISLHEEVVKEKSFTKARFISLFSRVAAVLILPLLVYSLFLTSRITKSGLLDSSVQVAWQTVKTTPGMQTDLFLPDGSHVWLNSGSELKYQVPFTTDFRKVELVGEAFFDVTKDQAHPFLVQAGRLNIEVKGTRFNVINYKDEKSGEVILESGSVRIFSGKYADQNTLATVKPGERACFDYLHNQMTVSQVDLTKYTSWKEGLLIFKNDPMDVVVQKLSRWFNVEIELQSPELKKYVYTATYRDETLAQILELLKISAPIKYSISDRKKMDDSSFSRRKIILTKRN
jgi:ferric-dicitrate binding protein FerR (iron transport regulator)